MAWLYGEPVNEKHFLHNAHPLTFFANRCDFRDGVYVVVPDDIKMTPDMWIKATAQVMGFHSVNIHRELNGFSGYDAISYTLVSPEEAEPIRLALRLGSGEM